MRDLLVVDELLEYPTYGQAVHKYREFPAQFDADDLETSTRSFAYCAVDRQV